MTYLTTTTGPFAIFNDPFFIGFDNQFSRLWDMHTNNAQINYPPYNIVKENEDNFRVEVAVAGFAKSDLTITVEDESIIVKGDIEEKSEDNFVHKGIASRKFTREFALGEYMEVQSATVENGMLIIKVERIVPEDKKPKTIKIK